MLVTVNIENLKKLRESRGYSKHKLSIMSGLGKNAVDQIEKGYRKASYIRIQALANVLQVPVSDLIIKEDL